jgi:transcriptional regulator GlxA family with amidase domain
MNRTIYFFIIEDVHLLDLSGAVQVFQEAREAGLPYTLQFIGDTPGLTSAAGLKIHDLTSFKKVEPSEHDIIVVPGYDVRKSDISNLEPFSIWLRKFEKKGVTICSVCTGAFLLAKAGLLNNKKCTTHWKHTAKLQKDYPQAQVLENKLYVKSGNIYTSAGIATGIDLALFLLEEHHGKAAASTIAKELVVYIRREGTDTQESVYLQYRNHTDEKIHQVQDWIVRNLNKKLSLHILADKAHTSPRNLTRIFKQHTGITLSDYQNNVRIEKAKKLLSASDYKLEHIAQLCGFNTAKQLRILLTKQLHKSPRDFIRNQMS